MQSKFFNLTNLTNLTNFAIKKILEFFELLFLFTVGYLLLKIFIIMKPIQKPKNEHVQKH